MSNGGDKSDMIQINDLNQDKMVDLLSNNLDVGLRVLMDVVERESEGIKGKSITTAIGEFADKRSGIRRQIQVRMVEDNFIGETEVAINVEIQVGSLDGGGGKRGVN